MAATGGTGGSAGTGLIPGGVTGDAVGSLATIQLLVNLESGFTGFSEESYELNVATGATHYEHSDGTVVDETASAEEIDALVTLVEGIEWWTRADTTLGRNVDGGSYPPKLTLTDATSSVEFQTSCGTPVQADTGAHGKLLGCEDTAEVQRAFEAIVAVGSATGCSDWW